MPVSPEYTRELVRDILTVYQSGEALLLEKLARRLAGGNPDVPGWLGRKLAEVQGLRRDVEAVLAGMGRAGGAAAAAVMQAAYGAGAELADQDLTAAPSAAASVPDPVRTERAVRSVVQQSTAVLQATGLPIRRSILDAYLDITQKTAAQVVTGVLTRREATARALEEYAARGITGFADRAGRQWDLASYAEMATRTQAAQAMVAGHADRLIEAGHELVIVSNAPEECKLCRPWEGKILSLSGGQVGQITAESATTGRQIQVRVAGTLAQATGAGLLHPNCRHSVSAYIPGATQVPTDTADPEGDQLRQQQRALERAVRERKRSLAAVKGLHNGYDGPRPNPYAKRLAKARASATASQQRLDEFVDARGRKKLPYRTAVGKAAPPKAPSAKAVPKPTAPKPAPKPRPVPRPWEERVRAARTEQAALDAAPISVATMEHGVESKALRTYTTGYYQWINGGLRHDRWVMSLEFVRDARASIPHIDSALARSPLAADVLAWRGGRLDPEFFGGPVGRDLTGFSWRDKAYTSTTASEEVATNAFSGRGEVLMRILLPAGQHAAAVGDMSGEAELLLPRGTTFRVVRDRGYRPDGRRLLDVEIVQ